MPVTASQVFSFLERKEACIVERHELAMFAFGTLRRSLRQIVQKLRETDDEESLNVSDRLRSLLSEWLTVPIQFDRSLLDDITGLLGHDQLRWGKDIRTLFQTASNATKQFMCVENPVREELRAVVKDLLSGGRLFKIYCDRRARSHFESLFAPPNDCSLPNELFLHSVCQYRESEPFDTLIKVGPLRSRGWGSAPDALLSAPRYKKLVQIVWGGCGDEPGFGYDPASPPSNIGTADGVVSAIAGKVDRGPIKWSTQVIRTGEDPGAVEGYSADADELRVFRLMNQRPDRRSTALVQVDEKHGILYPPHAKILSFDPNPSAREPIGFRIPNETLVEGMFLIRPVVDDVDFGGIKAKHGQYSLIWKTRLNEEWQKDGTGFIKRLRESGLALVHLGSAIEHWCEPPTTVIHAPQQKKHFEILVKVLGLKNDNSVLTQFSWWRLAWAEIGRSRGEAVQAGVQEQEIIEEQLLGILRVLLPEIRDKATTNEGFTLSIPARTDVHGLFLFFKVSAIEHGFHAPDSELKVVRELKVIEQWRD